MFHGLRMILVRIGIIRNVSWEMSNRIEKTKGVWERWEIKENRRKSSFFMTIRTTSPTCHERFQFLHSLLYNHSFYIILHLVITFFHNCLLIFPHLMLITHPALVRSRRFRGPSTMFYHVLQLVLSQQIVHTLPGYKQGSCVLVFPSFDLVNTPASVVQAHSYLPSLYSLIKLVQPGPLL